MAAQRVDVVVVGAGLAGLAAAGELSEAGREVVVLEKADKPGGRLCSEAVPEGVVELGAQYAFSSPGRGAPEMVRRAGLGDCLVAAAGGIGVLTGGRILSAVPGVEPAGDWMQTARHEVTGRPLYDLGGWGDLSLQTADVWARHAFGDAFTDMYVASVMYGMYGERLPDVAAPFAASVLGLGAEVGAGLNSVSGGMERVAGGCAETLDVRYGVRVKALTDSTQGGVLVSTSIGPLLADRVVLAVPADAARRVYLGCNPLEELLLRTPYRPALVAGLRCSQRLDDDVLGGCHQVVAHPDERTGCRVVYVGSRAGRALDGGDVLTVVFSSLACAQLTSAADEVVFEEAKRFVTGRDPSLGALLSPGPVKRWDEAVPMVAPGHAADVIEYRATLAPDSKVVLAGDYLGFPWMDAAVFNGKWAARHIVSRNH